MVDEGEPAVGAASPEATVGPADAAAEAPIASTDHMEAPGKKSDQSEPPPGRPRALTRAPECAPTAAPHTAGLGADGSGGEEILEPGQRLSAGPWTSRVCGHLWKVCVPPPTPTFLSPSTSQ